MRADDVIAEGPTLLSGSAGTEPPVPGDDRLAAGARAGEYEVERLVGAGAMGDVYAGRHPLIGKRVAIKVIKRRLAASAEAVERFLREARAANAVEHPHVIDVFAVGRLDDGRLYLVMDLLDGESLGARLRRGIPPVADALGWLDAIADALDAAHARGVIHRDLKPDNVFLTRGGGVFVVDFGIAKLLAAGDTPAPGTLTDQGTWLGTPAYMAPEQWGADGAGPASDRYALGAIAFELLSGTPPFRAGTLPQMMEQHFRAAVPTLSTGAAAIVPPAADRVLARALAKDPDARYPSARAMVDELRAAMGDTRAAPRRRTALVAALGGAVAVGALATGVIVLGGGSSRAPSAPAVKPPPAPAGTIEVITTPPGAHVKVGGVDRGQTPMSLALDGATRLVLSRPGYLPATVAAGAEDVHVTLAPVTRFEGVWALPDGTLRAFARKGDQVAMFSLAAADGERRFERFFEFVDDGDGATEFVAAEDHVDPRAPDDPSCHVPLRAEYRYDPVSDALTRRQERVQIDFAAGHCAIAVQTWADPVALRRLDASAPREWAESNAGSAPIKVGKVGKKRPKAPVQQSKLGQAAPGALTNIAKDPAPVNQPAPAPQQPANNAPDRQQLQQAAPPQQISRPANKN